MTKVSANAKNNSIWKLGVCYYPEHWPRQKWKSDIEVMAGLGIERVRIGEFAWSCIEPKPEQFHFDWIDEVLLLCQNHGIKVVLGTPTATPPRWMLDRHPDMLAKNANNDFRRFGSRRHYCFSHQGYRKECRRIVEILAERYANHEAVMAWQTDNEYGCHDTTYSYSDAAKKQFRLWLLQKYKNIEELNKSWGNVFWNMQYDDFSQIDPPLQTVTEANPAHQIDFRRFSSDQVASFNALQCNAIKTVNPKATVIHNFMGQSTDFDHYDVSKAIEIASWDSYPLGFLQIRNEDESFKKRFSRQGDPDFQAFHHDLYASMCNGRWWVMEQQPGPVNWAPINTCPLPGMVRLWSWEAFAHGAEVVSYFRFRQCRFAQEQMHTGLLLPNGEEDQGAVECKRLDREIKEIATMVDHKPALAATADVAIVFDYPSQWTWEIQPQTVLFSYIELVYLFYKTLRKLGKRVRFYSQTQLAETLASAGSVQHSLVIIPGLATMEQPLCDALMKYRGKILLGPRTAAKDKNFAIPTKLPPQLDRDFLPLKVKRVEGLGKAQSIKVGRDGKVHIWREHVETTGEMEIVLKDDEQVPFLLRKANVNYLAGWPDSSLLGKVFAGLLKNNGLLPEGVRVSQYRNLLFFFNYGTETHQVPCLMQSLEKSPKLQLALDGKTLPPTGVSVCKLF